MTSKRRFHFLHLNLNLLILFYCLLFGSILYSKFASRSSVALHPLLPYISYFSSFVSSPYSSCQGINFQRKHLAINFTLEKSLRFALSSRPVHNTAVPMLNEGVTSEWRTIPLAMLKRMGQLPQHKSNSVT
jgi:hypothetical protein